MHHKSRKFRSFPNLNVFLLTSEEEIIEGLEQCGKQQGKNFSGSGAIFNLCATLKIMKENCRTVMKRFG
jgi:hypothetical protein